MPDQALDAAQRFGQHEDPGLLHEPAGPFRVAEIEGDHPAESAHLPAGELVLRVRGQARIVDLRHPRLVGEPFGDPAAAGIVLPHAERQGLDPAERQPAVHRPRHPPGRVLNEAQPLGQVVPRGDQQAAHHVAVAVQVLGRRVEHDVGPVLERPLEIRGGEGVVHHVQVPVRLGEIAERGQIRQVHHRIGRRLAVDHAGGRRERPLDVADVAHVHEGDADAQVAVDPLHQPVASAVDVLAADDVISGLEQLQHRVEGGQAGAEGKAVGGALEAGHVSLQRLPGGVLGPAVLVAPVLAEAGLDVGGRLVDRRHDRAGERLDDLPGMHGAGGKAVVVVLRENPGHRCLRREGRGEA